MVQKVFKYGNSLAVTLPKDIAAAAGIEVGSLVQADVVDGRVVVQPVEVVPKLAPQDEAFVQRAYQKRRRVFEALGE